MLKYIVLMIAMLLTPALHFQAQETSEPSANPDALTPVATEAPVSASVADYQPCALLATTLFKRAEYIPNAQKNTGALPDDRVLVSLFVLQGYEFGDYRAMSQPDKRYIRVISSDDVICWFRETVVSVGSG
jgi:hypothetical protein